MSEYCDSKKLERNWHSWLLSSTTPDLEVYRKLGILWTKSKEPAKDKDGNIVTVGGKLCLNPLGKNKSHCLALGNHLTFESHDGKTDEYGILQDGSKIHLPTEAELSLEAESILHDLSNPYKQLGQVIPDLIEKGYIFEMPIETSWHAMLDDVLKMCKGISVKFFKNEDDQMELAQEALIQVSNKLKNKKLVYTPGRAPVFNLLTTTIYNCMFSIINKNNRYKQNTFKLATDLATGTIPKSTRSLKVPSSHIFQRTYSY